MNDTVGLNLVGRINAIKLPKKDYLIPLFGCVVNSIQAIDEAGIKDGKIDVYVERSKVVQERLDGKVSVPKLTGFRIVDNGIGFDKTNYESFKTDHSDHKIQMGGKGVGRFMALKVFHTYSVSSNYLEEADRQHYTRRFSFSATKLISNLSNAASNEKVRKTEVYLQGMRSDYRPKSNPSGRDIAESVLNHCLIFFILNAPEIIIHDDYEANPISLRELFEQIAEPQDLEDRFEINKEEFSLNYVRVYLPGARHQIHYCAAKREVKNKNLSDILPHLSKSLEDDRGEYQLSVYVQSKYLDEQVSENRTSLDIPEEGEVSLFGLVSLQSINKRIKEKVGDLLEDELAELFQENRDEYSDYILREGFEYTHFLDNEEFFEKLSPASSDKKKEDELHRVNYLMEKEQKKKVRSFLQRDVTLVEEREEYREQLHQILRNQEGFNKSKLAAYLVHRKVVLKVFDKFLEVQKDGTYKYENEIHDIIFPRGTSNGEVPYVSHNLWLLDERMTFHHFISSDQPLQDNPHVDSDSGEKPDLLSFFDRSFGYSDEAQAIATVFEFKRPGKDIRGEDKKLEDQIERYIRALIKSNARDYRGRRTEIEVTTPKVAYIIVDYDKVLAQDLKDMQDYKPAPKGGFFKYREGLNMLIYVMNYKQLLKDAEERHKIFFNKLGIHNL